MGPLSQLPPTLRQYLREDELSAVLDAAERVQRAIILRIMADA